MQVGIRTCAMASEAFKKLKNAYENREEYAVSCKKAGKKVIAALGTDVPEELCLAAGMAQIKVYADEEKELVLTNKYLEYAFDPVIRSTFEKLIDGTYGDLSDAIVVSNSTDVVIRTFLYLRELKRVEPERNIPDIAFIDWLFTRNRMHQDRNELTLKIFWEQLEKWAGRKITNEDLLAAAKVCNENKAALRKLQELRNENKITGSEAMVAICSGFFMNKEEHTKLVNDLYEDAKSWPETGLKKVFLTGSNQENTKLYEKIEAAGMNVVSEDHDWGARVYDRDFNLDYTPIRGLVDCYMLREFSSKKAFVSQRVDALNREVDSCKANGVIFYTNIYEEAASWDYPSQKESLEGRDIKTLGLFKMQWPIEKNETLEEKLSAFAKEIK